MKQEEETGLQLAVMGDLAEGPEVDQKYPSLLQRKRQKEMHSTDFSVVKLRD